MKLIEVKVEEAGISKADYYGTDYTYYNVKLRFEEFPKMWFKYDTGDGMMIFEKMRRTEKELLELVEK